MNKSSIYKVALALVAALALAAAPAAAAPDKDVCTDAPHTIDHLMERLETHADEFEDQFEDDLEISTVDIDKRPRYERWASQLEAHLDELKDEWKERDIEDFHEELDETLAVAASMNRFMLRADFGESQKLWNALRDDLNALAGPHFVPALPVFVIVERPAQSNSNN